MKTRTHTPTVVLNLPEHVPDYIRGCRTCTTALEQNAATFPSAAALVTKTDADVDLLETRELAIKTGTHGAADARNQQLAMVKSDMLQIRALVQQVIDANPAQAETLAAQAGLHLRKPTTRRPRLLSVREGDASGSADVIWPSAGKHAAYNAQTSIDGGKTWSDMITTDLARARFSGLPVGATLLVRYRATIKGVTGNWSEPTSFVVR